MIPLNSLGDDFISFPDFVQQLRVLEMSISHDTANVRDYFTRKHLARRRAVRTRLRAVFYRRTR